MKHEQKVDVCTNIQKKVDWVQQVFQQSFAPLAHLETFDMSVSKIMQ